MLLEQGLKPESILTVRGHYSFLDGNVCQAVKWRFVSGSRLHRFINSDLHSLTTSSFNSKQTAAKHSFKMRSYIAEQRRLQRERGSGTASSALADPHTIPVEVLRTARTSGVLTLSLRQLKFVPDSVYAMYEPANRAPGENWWDQVDLTLIDLSNNEIGGIDGVKFGELAPRLKTLKLDSNEIGELPDSAVEKMIETLEVLNLASVIVEGI
ncbi:hypothetical protein GQ42DRAFT_154240 [Ramicandelaber brevisporus]|nr:hypothetical protein GQ42DRAFT_154240 [Ramicandelaber brevisporus]